MQKMIFVAVCIATSLSAACAALRPVGDGAFRVRGVIGDARPGALCTLSVWNEELGQFVSVRPVMAAFDETVLVSPTAGRYHLELRCDGQQGVFKSRVYVLGGLRYYSPALDLGTLRLGS
jgi:hypothetical protein